MSTTSPAVARFVPSSDQSLLIYFGDDISRETHEAVVRFVRVMEGEAVAGVRNLHPGYCSVLVKFDALRWTHDELEVALRERIGWMKSVELPAPQLVEVPVCYDGEYGPDLAEVCALRGLTRARAVELHTATEYRVYFLGFVPGFAYLGELPGELESPRLASPRRQVPAGSVGIAGRQTGVYPLATPGGWRLIGRTPMRMFRAEDGGACALAMGNRVRFRAISAEQFGELEKSWR